MSSTRIGPTPLPSPTLLPEAPTTAAASTRAAHGPAPEGRGAAGADGAVNTVSVADPRRGAAPVQPRAVPTGTRDYYVERARDFEARHPGLRAPDYYLDYGDRYIRAFSALGPQELSPAGLAWRDAVRAGLQRALEARRREDPEAFARLERDPAALRSFAFGTHARVYLEAGLLELPAQDLATILTVPDLRDLLSADGVRQACEVLQATRPADVATVLDWTVNESLRQAARLGDDAARAAEALGARLRDAALH